MTARDADCILTNARVVLADRVIDRGWLAVSDGVIAEFGEGQPPERGRRSTRRPVDARPGRIAHRSSRSSLFAAPQGPIGIPSQRWCRSTDSLPPAASPRCWICFGCGQKQAQKRSTATPSLCANAIAQARSAQLLRVEHFLHLRCEVPMPTVVAEAKELIGRSDVRLASLMDHTPGQRQFRDESKLRDYYRGKKGGLTDAELDRLLPDAARQSSRLRGRELPTACRSGWLLHATPLASHDDTTLEHVADAVRDRVSIAEFPTTTEAAEALHDAGIRRADGCAQSGAGWLARRQCRHGRSRQGRHARRVVIGLHAGEFADGGAKIAGGCSRH